MENSDVTEQNGEKKSPLKILTSESSADYLKSWPVALPVPVKSISIDGSLRPSSKRRSRRFKYSSVKNWLIPLDGPMSMDHVHFLLDCFVVSAGPGPLQLGRYHPQSDPEEFVRKEPHLQEFVRKEPHLQEFVRKETRSLDEDTRSPSSEEDDEGGDFWAKVSRFPYHDANDSEEDAGPSSPSTVDWIPTKACFGYTFDTVDWTPEDYGGADEYTFENYFPRWSARREVSEMRLVLERLLDHEREMRQVLEMLPDDVLGPGKDPPPHFPAGDWELLECGVCLDPQWLYRRPCCGFAACAGCLKSYYSEQVAGAGRVQVECCNCGSYAHRDEISATLDADDKERFRRLLVLANQDSGTKTCPRCSHLTARLFEGPKQQKKKDQKYPSRVTCPSCLLEWCFDCHAPWHSAVSCRQFRKGDRLLREWAKERNRGGQLNAQKCPRCRIYIQRTTGCDHMHCSRCKTDFCYRCGERFRYLKFFGDHYSKLSIFGCKYRFKADQPLQRKLIRGAIFGGKVLAAPVVGAVALCAGAVAVSVSLFALPALGGLRLYCYCKSRRQQTKKVIPKHVFPPSPAEGCARFFRR